MVQKTKFLFFVALGLSILADAAQAQTSVFTYQGRLNSGASPANGIYDLRFAIYDSASGGTQQGGNITNASMAVSNGVFMVTLDFGNQFPGTDRWLEISVRSNGVSSFSVLSPRQKLTAAPYAITASNLSGTLPVAQLTGTVPNAQLSASVSLLGQSIDSSEITDGTIATNDLSSNVLNGTFWKLGGNTGANPTNGIFLGTTDNQPLEFKVNGQRGLRLEYADDGSFKGVNVIGGYSSNFVAGGVVGATVGGGGIAGEINQVLQSFGTIGGGRENTVSGHTATVGGGRVNRATAFGATVGGGANNLANGQWATVGGGSLNQAIGLSATVPGGDGNVAGGSYSFAAGRRARADHQGAFVWADSTDANFASTANDQFLIRASGGVGIGTGSPGQSLDVVVDESAKNYGGIRVRNINPTIGGERTVLLDLLNNDPSSGVTYRLQNVGNVSGRSGNFEIYQLGGVAGGARLAITTNGNVGIGTTSLGALLEVNGTAAKPGGGSWSVASDARLKKNIEDLHGSLDRLLQLRSVSFEYKDPKHGAGPQIGFIAQEVRKVMPQWVTEGPDGMLAVSVTGFESLTVDALRELRAEKDKQIGELKAENAELKARLDRIEQLLAEKPITRAQ